MALFELHNGDCLEYMRGCEPNSIDTIICDPPYGLSFMGKDWDHGIPGVPFWQAALRVAKPGAMMLAFGGTRTHHRLMCAIEDAGWEIRDCLMWLYGSGFPKSHDISKGIDKAAGAEREVVGVNLSSVRNKNRNTTWTGDVWGDNGATITAPATDAATLWHGWGTALKPAWEPIIMAMKPLDGTFAQNAMKHGVAGLNIDGSRIGTSDVKTDVPYLYKGNNGNSMGAASERLRTNGGGTTNPSGRWPANLILDEEAGTQLGESSRFFYCAKASRREREEGLEGMTKIVGKRTQDGGDDTRGHPLPVNANHHPTVKPLALMRYLVRLTATPTGGIVFDPFMGSGTTGIAAIKEGRRFIGCELQPEYFEIAKRRIEKA